MLNLLPYTFSTTNTSNLDGVDNADSDQIVIGGKYFYQPNIIMHAYAGMNKADNVSTVVGTNPSTPGSMVGGNFVPGTPESDIIAKGDTEVFVIGTGLEYKF